MVILTYCSQMKQYPAVPVIINNVGDAGICEGYCMFLVTISKLITSTKSFDPNTYINPSF